MTTPEHPDFQDPNTVGEAEQRFDAVVLDTDSNGVEDTALVDLDGDGTIDAVVLDSDGDNYANTVLVDVDGDGEFDEMYIDSDNTDGVLETKLTEDDYIEGLGNVEDYIAKAAEDPADQGIDFQNSTVEIPPADELEVIDDTAGMDDADGGTLHLESGF